MACLVVERKEFGALGRKVFFYCPFRLSEWGSISQIRRLPPLCHIEISASREREEKHLLIPHPNLSDLWPSFLIYRAYRTRKEVQLY